MRPSRGPAHDPQLLHGQAFVGRLTALTVSRHESAFRGLRGECRQAPQFPAGEDERSGTAIDRRSRTRRDGWGGTAPRHADGRSSAPAASARRNSGSNSPEAGLAPSEPPGIVVRHERPRIDPQSHADYAQRHVRLASAAVDERAGPELGRGTVRSRPPARAITCTSSIRRPPRHSRRSQLRRLAQLAGRAGRQAGNDHRFFYAQLRPRRPASWSTASSRPSGPSKSIQFELFNTCITKSCARTTIGWLGVYCRQFRAQGRSGGPSHRYDSRRRSPAAVYFARDVARRPDRPSAGRRRTTWPTPTH